jgi:hypothetical protein
MDPSEEEVKFSKGTLVLSCMPALGTVTSVWQSGQMKAEDVLEVSPVFPSCKHILTFLESAWVHVKKNVLNFIL